MARACRREALRALESVRPRAHSTVDVEAQLDAEPLRFATDGPGAPQRATSALAVGATHQLELAVGGDAAVYVQSILRSRVPWSTFENLEKHPRLNYTVGCDPTAGNLEARVACTARVHRQGWGGMLVAEVGLPPGVQVDRRSFTSRGGYVGDWEVDERSVRAYDWPRPGEPTELSFRFDAQMAIDARSAPSRLWDYYDPETQVVLPPVDYRIAE